MVEYSADDLAVVLVEGMVFATVAWMVALMVSKSVALMVALMVDELAVCLGFDLVVWKVGKSVFVMAAATEE